MEVKGKTSSGFEFVLETENMNDMRFIDALAEVENNNVLMISEVLTMMLGKAQKNALYSHLADKDGKVSPTLCMNEIREIFDLAGDNVKN